MLKNSEYWKQRFEQLEAAQNGMGASALADIEKQYRQAQKEIEGKIAAWYQRFADNNGISMSEARKYLSGADLKEFKWDVQDYIKYGQENALDGLWMKELENASAKFHISKLEALKVHTQQSLESLFSKQLGTVQGAMADIVESGYFHTAYELQKGFGVGWDIAGLDQSQIEKLLSKPWAADGLNFSERIWGNKGKLIDTVHKELTQNVMLGADPQKAIDSIAKQMNTSKNNAGRLVMTEEAYFSSAAQKDCFNDLDVEQYEIVATLDSHTSDICRSLDGKVFDMKDFEPGVTAPPFHVYCRSTTVPYFNDDFDDPGERAARDENGETYYIPDDMKYKDWKETFVDGGDKSGFDVYEANGTVHYTKHVEPEAPKPKKEYLTKKKLQANIANADVQLEDLENQFKAVSGGWSYDEAIKDFGSLEGFADGDDLSKMQGLKSQMEALEQQKAEWQQKLDEKLKKEQKKALLKQQAEAQQQLDDFEVKTYSGIWKDDVTTADWAAKQGSIEAKKKYYEGKFITETDPDKMQEFQNLYKQLDEFDTEGKSYHQIQTELKKIQADLNKLEKGDIIDAAEEAFTQERKDAAYWFKDKPAADAVLRPTSGEVWRNATSAERSAAYKYTSGSGSFNRPLRGYDRSWSNFKGVGNVDLDNEGSGDAIKRLQSIIDKSTYDFDIWLNRGIETTSGAASFLQIPESVLRNASQDELEKLLLGKVVKDEAFVSCGSAKGTGFSGYIFNVYAPKGTKMIYAEPFSAFGSGGGKTWDGLSTQSYFGHEFETIIQSGTEFRITKVEKTGGNVYFDVEIVGQP